MMPMAEVQAEVAATKAALAALRASVMLICPPQVRVSERTEHILRIGTIWLEFHKTDSFGKALGFPPARRFGPIGNRHPDYRPVSDGQRNAVYLGNMWKAFRSRPPVNPKDKTYRYFLDFFSQHWPADLEWPRDIARPASTSKERAA